MIRVSARSEDPCRIDIERRGDLLQRLARAATASGFDVAEIALAEVRQRREVDLGQPAPFAQRLQEAVAAQDRRGDFGREPCVPSRLESGLAGVVDGGVGLVFLGFGGGGDERLIFGAGRTTSSSPPGVLMICGSVKTVVFIAIISLRLQSFASDIICLTFCVCRRPRLRIDRNAAPVS